MPPKKKEENTAKVKDEQTEKNKEDECSGPIGAKDRECRDLLCCVMFLCNIAAIVALAGNFFF